MTEYASLSKDELKREHAHVSALFEAEKQKGLKLDMSRGKPAKAQLDLSAEMLTILKTSEDCFDGNIDARNYGELTGLPSAKRFFAELLGVAEDEVIVGGSASLNLMYDIIAKAHTHGLLRSEAPWSKLEKVKFLCPSPGYDRHFKVSESFSMELITIPMTAEGPDMDAVEEAVKDPAVKGMWCTPKFSNPEGIIYSDATLRRIAQMETAAPDFALMWDNAYCVHEFAVEYKPFPSMLSLCREAGHPDRVYEFASTSKITFPGAGISVVSASRENIEYIKKLLSIEIISYDKLNQLRHVRFLKDKAGVLALMKKHAVIMAPKFEAVLSALDSEIAPLGIASWKRPEGGYFISVDTMDGIAKRTLALCREAGVVMTSAGATYPHGVDPRDRNIRIAPSLPPVEELRAAVSVFCIALRLAALEKLMGD